MDVAKDVKYAKETVDQATKNLEQTKKDTTEAIEAIDEKVVGVESVVIENKKMLDEVKTTTTSKFSTVDETLADLQKQINDLKNK